jgi:hypothetical protein
VETFRLIFSFFSSFSSAPHLTPPSHNSNSFLSKQYIGRGGHRRQVNALDPGCIEGPNFSMGSNSSRGPKCLPHSSHSPYSPHSPHSSNSLHSLISPYSPLSPNSAHTSHSPHSPNSPHSPYPIHPTHFIYPTQPTHLIHPTYAIHPTHPTYPIQRVSHLFIVE